MYNSLASPLLYNCAFSNNKASYGGAIVNVGTCNPQAINCGFLNNTAANTGGAMFNAAAGGWCRPSLLNCSFQSNLAPTGSVMYNSVDVTGDCITSLTNCIVFNNNGSDDIKKLFCQIHSYLLPFRTLCRIQHCWFRPLRPRQPHQHHRFSLCFNYQRGPGS